MEETCTRSGGTEASFSGARVRGGAWWGTAFRPVTPQPRHRHLRSQLRLPCTETVLWFVSLIPQGLCLVMPVVGGQRLADV